MAVASTLAQAAGMSFDNLQVRWLTGLLQFSTTFFQEQVLLIFPDNNERGRPVAHWGTVLASIASQIPTGVTPISYLNDAAQTVYRLCWMGSYLQTAGLITTADANNLLSAYNGSIGFP